MIYYILKKKNISESSNILFPSGVHALVVNSARMASKAARGPATGERRARNVMLASLTAPENLDLDIHFIVKF